MPDTKSDGLSLWSVAVSLCLIGSCSDMDKLTKRVDALANGRHDRLAAIEEESRKSPGPVALWQYFQRVRDLERRVLTPRFGRHAGTCAQCRGDVPSEEGGPGSLCARGFALWQHDLREQKAADVAEAAEGTETSEPPEEPAE